MAMINNRPTLSEEQAKRTGLELGEKPNWSLKKPGDAFQFTEVYTPPGLESVSDVTRTIQSESVTDTTTIFSQ